MLHADGCTLIDTTGVTELPHRAKLGWRIFKRVVLFLTPYSKSRWVYVPDQGWLTQLQQHEWPKISRRASRFSVVPWY